MFADKYTDESTTQLSIFLLVQENSSHKDTQDTHTSRACAELSLLGMKDSTSTYLKKKPTV